MANGWVPPEVASASQGWTPPEVAKPPGQPTTDFSADDTPEAAEAKAGAGGAEAVASLASGGLASVPAGVDYLARSVIHGVGALIGYSVGGDDPVKRQQVTDWLSRKHQEDKDAFDNIANFWTYSPRTEQGQDVMKLPGEAVESGLSHLPDNAAQTVRDVGGDVLRASAAVPTLRAIPGLPGAVSAARAAKAAEATEAAAAAAPKPNPAAGNAVTADQLRSQPNPIPPPNADAATAPATLAVQKPKISPRPGESAQQAAARQGITPPAAQEAPGAAPATPATPSPARPPLRQGVDPAQDLYDTEVARLAGNTPQAPAGAQPEPAPQRTIFSNRQAGAARIFHPPAEDGPQYAAQASDADQTARRQTLSDVNELGGGSMSSIRKGAVTGDWEQTGNEHQTAKIPDAPGQLLRDQIASEHQTLHNATQNVADSVGSEARNDVDRDTLEQRGGIVRGAIHAIEDHFNNAANGMYQTARGVLGDRPMGGMPRVQQILEDASHDTNPTAASLRRAAQTKLQQLWSIGDTRGSVRTAPGTVGAAERFHEFLNESYHNDSSGLIRKLKNATDQDVAERAGGNDMFQAARNVIQHRETMLEPDGVNELRRPKDRNKVDHDVGLHEVMDHVTNQDSEHFEHFMNVLRAGAHLSPEVAEKSAAAIREIQGHMVARMHSAARGEGGAWNATNFYKAGNKFSTNLPAAFKENPKALENLQTINRAGNILKMDKSYPGAVAQAAKVGLIPGLAQKAIKGTKLAGELGGVAHGNVLMTAGAHLIGKGAEAGVEKLTARSRLATARESLEPLGAKIPGQRGAVGDLSQRDAVEHSETKRPDGTTMHNYSMPGVGGLAVKEYPELGVRQVHLANVNKESRGGGWGTRMLQRAADDAHANGQVLHSDSAVSEGQAGAYKNLASLGYKVTKKDADLRGGAYQSVGDHVFEVRPRAKVPESQRGSVRVTNEPEEKPATVNIGLHQGTPGEPGFRQMSKQEAVAALKSQGVRVGKTSVVQSNTEPTLVADIHRPLNPDEADIVAHKLNQDAIVQRDSTGNGALYGRKAGEWGPFNPDHFREHDGRTMSEHATSFNPDELEKGEIHPNSTVKNPIRSAYPGIYDKPSEIMSRVKTAPEDPIMKDLFGVTRKDLHDSAVARGDVAPKSIPGVKETARSTGSKAAQNVTTPENAERLRNVISAFKDHDESAYHGMVGWYEMHPLHAAVEKVLGKGKLADAAYSRLNTLMGMASPGSDVLTEINRGTAAHMMASKGEFGKFERYGGNPGSSGAVKNAPELANVTGHPYHSTAQSIPMRRYLDTGAGAQAPKTSMYVASSEKPGSAGYQNKVLVGDSHFSRGVGLSDVRTAQAISKSVSGPELATVHPWFHESVAKPSGLPSTSAQAVQWGALSHETGVDTAIGAPKLELFAQQVKKAAARMGVTPQEALTRIIKGIAHAG